MAKHKKSSSSPPAKLMLYLSWLGKVPIWKSLILRILPSRNVPSQKCLPPVQVSKNPPYLDLPAAINVTTTCLALVVGLLQTPLSIPSSRSLLYFPLELPASQHFQSQPIQNSIFVSPSLGVWNLSPPPLFTYQIGLSQAAGEGLWLTREFSTGTPTSGPRLCSPPMMWMPSFRMVWISFLFPSRNVMVVFWPAWHSIRGRLLFGPHPSVMGALKSIAIVIAPLPADQNEIFGLLYIYTYVCVCVLYVVGVFFFFFFFYKRSLKGWGSWNIMLKIITWCLMMTVDDAINNKNTTKEKKNK